MRKTGTQPAFATLTDAEIDQIAEWLRHDTYDIVLGASPTTRRRRLRPERLPQPLATPPRQNQSGGQNQRHTVRRAHEYWAWRPLAACRGFQSERAWR